MARVPQDTDLGRSRALGDSVTAKHLRHLVLGQLMSGAAARKPDDSAEAAFAILRWRPDPTRDEARNVAVMLTDSTGTRAGFLSAPLGSLQLGGSTAGLLDAVVNGLDVQFKAATKPTLRDLVEWRSRFTESIYLTEPQPVAVTDADATLRALYEAYVAPRRAESALSKAALVDEAVEILRKSGLELSRNARVGDFAFDIVIHGPQEVVVAVLSFAETGQDNDVERDAAHFVYALAQLGTRGAQPAAAAIIQDPVSGANEAISSRQRVAKWLSDAGAATIAPAGLEEFSRLIQRQLSFSR